MAAILYRPQCVKKTRMTAWISNIVVLSANFSDKSSVMAWSGPTAFEPVTSIGLSDVNTLRPRQNGRHFADDIFKRIFLNENILIPIKISLKFVPKGLINNIPALVQIMAWRRPGDKPLSETMMVDSTTHICVTRPQWVNSTQTPDTSDLANF